MSRSNKRKRTEAIRARVTPEEKATFLARCEAAGLSAGDYIRKVCLDMKPLRAVRRITLNQELVLKLLGQLSRIGNNFNQVVKKLNQGRRIKGIDRMAIQAAIDLTVEIRQHLNRILGYDSQR